jgi:hypothetical protein
MISDQVLWLFLENTSIDSHDKRNQMIYFLSSDSIGFIKKMKFYWKQMHFSMQMAELKSVKNSMKIDPLSIVTVLIID